MRLKRLVLFLMFLCLSYQLSAFRFPSTLLPGGWHKDGQPRVFAGASLYGHINGGSELFLEYGFLDLRVQVYRKGEETIAFEAYRMKSPESALGIYLTKAGNETPMVDIKTRNSGDAYQVLMVRSDYFFLINNFDGNPALVPLMKSLANQVVQAIPSHEPEPLFVILPEKNRVPGSLRLIRGHYSLQTIFTLGHGDVLLLKNKIFAVAADYQDQKGRVFTRIMAKYPDKERAAQAFSSLLNNLDSYLTLVEKSSHRFVFKDYKSKRGIVTLTGDTLEVILNTPLQA
jgi:Family of unknown function (DUF6599)